MKIVAIGFFLLFGSLSHAEYSERPKAYQNARRLCGFTHLPWGCGGPSTPTVEFNSTEFVDLPQYTCNSLESGPSGGYYCVNVIDELRYYGPGPQYYTRSTKPTGEFEYNAQKTEIRNAKRSAENLRYCGGGGSDRALRNLKGRRCWCMSGHFICN
jgi:hypothetical protein